MSLHLSMARIAAASNDNLSPWLSDKVSTPFAVWFGGIVCLMSFFCAIAMIYLDRPASREAAGVIVDVPSRRKDRGRSTAEERTALLGEESETMSPLYIHQRDELESDGAPPKPVTRDGEIGADIIVEDAQEADTLLEEDYDEEDETIHFSQLRGLSWSFWMLCLATIGLYGRSRIIPSLRVYHPLISMPLYRRICPFFPHMHRLLSAKMVQGRFSNGRHGHVNS